jgi:hypothetical protein
VRSQFSVSLHVVRVRGLFTQGYLNRVPENCYLFLYFRLLLHNHGNQTLSVAENGDPYFSAIKEWYV